MSHSPVTYRHAPEFYEPPAELARLQTRGLIAGAIGLIGCVLGFILDNDQFYRSYLVAWIFVLTIPLGCLGFSMIHHLTQGKWGLYARRAYEAASKSLVSMMLLGLPIIFGGFESLYIWSTPERAPEELQHLLHHKEPWLNAGGVTLRYLIVFAILLGLAFMLSRLSLRQDETGDVRLSRRMRVVAAPGLVLFVFATTVLGYDLLMSIEPAWFSTMYGVWLISAMGLGALCFTALLMRFLYNRNPLSHYVEKSHFHDWGKLMLAFVMLWAYFTISQFLIIWSGNQFEETEWYFHRIRHGWGPVAVFLFVAHFALPFGLLLSAELKKNTKRLAMISIFLLVMCWLDMFMQVIPSFYFDGPHFHWLDLVTTLAVGGLWFACFTWFFRRHPVMPYNDPYLHHGSEVYAGQEELVAHE